jgi:hypothetical protein
MGANRSSRKGGDWLENGGKSSAIKLGDRTKIEEP